MSLIRRGLKRRADASTHDADMDQSLELLDLNEHCLESILRELSVADLCAVKESCYYFHTLAEDVMKSRIRTKNFVLGNATKTELVAQLRPFLKFCKFAHGLIVSTDKTERKDCDLIFEAIEYANPNLSYLQLTVNRSSMDDVRVRLHNVFANPQEIEISCASDKKVPNIQLEHMIKDILQNCMKMEKFTFDGLESCYRGYFLQQKLSNLRSLGLFNLDEFDVNNLKSFVKCNPQIQELSVKLILTDSKETNLRDIVNQFLGMEVLEYLAIGTQAADVLRIVYQQPRTLRYFLLYGLNRQVNDRVAETLRDLFSLILIFRRTTIHGQIDNFFPGFLKNLNNLTYLGLTNFKITIEQFKDIICNRVRLRHFNLESPDIERINEKQFLEYVNLRRLKNAAKPLSILLVGNARDIDDIVVLIPNDILLTHVRVIEISFRYD